MCIGTKEGNRKHKLIKVVLDLIFWAQQVFLFDFVITLFLSSQQKAFRVFFKETYVWF